MTESRSDMPPEALLTFDRALAAADTPQSVWQALEALARATIGAKLFTVMMLDMDQGVAARVFTSDADAYPVSGVKPIHRDAWFAQVHDRREPFVANTIEEIARVFPDHETIRNLGCGSVVNLPIVIGDAVVGTVNCLDVAHHFDAARLAQVELLSLPAKAACLAAAYHGIRAQPAGRSVLSAAFLMPS